MANENLTRAQAYDRAEQLTVHDYQIHLDLSGTGATFGSVTTVRFDCRTPGWSTFIDLIAPQVTAATLNGNPLPLSSFAGGQLPLPDLAAENELVVHADCAYMNTGEGLHRFIDPVDNETYLYTQFEVADARRVFACFDQPDLKATYQFTVTAPHHWTVVSTAQTPTPTVAGPKLSTWEFAPSERMSTYIAAIIAGPYHQVSDELTSCDGRTIPMKILCRPSLAEYLDAEVIFELTKRGFNYYENTFEQPYPFSKYDQIFVPEFNAGAMENAGAVTYRDHYIFRSKVSEATRERRALTILHELAHMWFGNLVTMHWWDDLWLNESFAEWASTICMTQATKYTTAWTTFAIHEKNWAYRQDQLPSTHPIVADMVDLAAVDANFDGITYAKGAATLKQLVHYVGADSFNQALVHYFAEHKWGNTRLPDFLSKLAAASGRDLTEWSSKWLEKSGVPTLRPELTCDDAGVVTDCVIHQSAPQAYPTLRPHRLVVGCYNVVDGKLTRTARHELDVAGATTSVPALVGEPRPDLVLVNDEDFTYAKIRLDEASLACVLRHMNDVTDPLTRVLLWTAIYDMTRDGELATRDFLDFVTSNIASETHPATRSTVLEQLGLLSRQGVHPTHQHQAHDQVAGRLWELTKSAAPGSDEQLLYVNSFIGFARQEEHLGHLQALLAGDFKLPKLTMDVDFRWRITIALATGGALTEADIAAELATDNTASGALSAATARAAIPTAAAKAAAWEKLMTDDTLANDTQMAIISGFNKTHNPELLTPYIEPYFECLERIWAHRTAEMAGQITTWLYPLRHGNQEVLATTTAYLAAHPDLPSAQHRIMIEQADHLARNLRCHARDLS